MKYIYVESLPYEPVSLYTWLENLSLDSSSRSLWKFVVMKGHTQGSSHPYIITRNTKPRCIQDIFQDLLTYFDIFIYNTGLKELRRLVSLVSTVSVTVLL